MDTTSSTKCFSAFLILLSVSAAIAQAPAGIDPAEAARQRHENDQILRELYQTDASAPALYPEEESDVGPQSILRIKPRHTWFDVGLDSQMYYTDNLFYQEKDRTESSVFLNSAQFAVTPPAISLGSGSLRPRLGYRHQWYNYGLFESGGDKNNFDFDAQTVFADTAYDWNGWYFQAGFEWNRLLGHEPDYSDYDEIYTEYAPAWSVRRYFPIHEKLVLLAGYLGRYHFSNVDLASLQNEEEDLNDRWDHVFLLYGSYAVCPHWVIQPYYRLQFTDYTRVSRDDILNSFGLSVAWFCNKYFNVRGFVGYDMLESDDSLVADYRVLNAGGGINANFRF